MASQQLRTILAIVVNVFEAHTAALFLPQADEPGLRLAAHFSLGDDMDPQAVITPGAGLAGWVMNSGQPLNVANMEGARAHPGYYRREVDIKAFMAQPLELQGDARGVLCVDTKRSHAFGTREQKILQQFAQVLAGLVETGGRLTGGQTQAGYYRALAAMTGLREKFSRWPAFLEHFLGLMTQAAGLDSAFLAVLAGEDEHYAVDGMFPRGTLRADELGPFPLGSGLAGWVFNNNAMVAAGEDGQPPGPIMGTDKGIGHGRVVCLPLYFQRRVRGVLVACGRQPGPLGDECKDFLRICAANLTLFLENLYLRSRRG